MKSSHGNIGSIGVSTIEEGLETFDYEDEIVLYHTGPPRTASRMACRFMKAHRYEHVRRYSGELEKWESAGHLLEPNTPDNRTAVFAPAAHKHAV